MRFIVYFINTCIVLKKNTQKEKNQIKIVEIVLENDVLFEREIDLRF